MVINGHKLQFIYDYSVLWQLASRKIEPAVSVIQTKSGSGWTPIYSAESKYGQTVSTKRERYI